MPSKSQRAAARQARLSRRKRKEKSRQDFDTGPTESQASTRTAVAEPVDGAENASSAVATQRPKAPDLVAAPRQRRRSSVRGRAAAAAPEQASVYKYLPGELRQIGIITSVIAVVLAVLTVVLR